MHDGHYNDTHAACHRTIRGTPDLWMRERNTKTAQTGSQTGNSLVVECLENLEKCREQGANEEVISNVAGLVYLGKYPPSLTHPDLYLTMLSSNGRYRSYLQIGSDAHSDGVGLDKYGTERVLPGNGSQYSHSEESTKTVGRSTRRRETARTLGFGPTSLHHRSHQGNPPMGPPGSPWHPSSLDGG